MLGDFTVLADETQQDAGVRRATRPEQIALHSTGINHACKLYTRVTENSMCTEVSHKNKLLPSNVKDASFLVV